jgi:hypothetical protein
VVGRGDRASGRCRPAGANAELIKHFATIKREADEVEEDGVVAITEMDVEG